MSVSIAAPQAHSTLSSGSFAQKKKISWSQLAAQSVSKSFSFILKKVGLSHEVEEAYIYKQGIYKFATYCTYLKNLEDHLEDFLNSLTCCEKSLEDMQEAVQRSRYYFEQRLQNIQNSIAEELHKKEKLLLQEHIKLTRSLYIKLKFLRKSFHAAQDKRNELEIVLLSIKIFKSDCQEGVHNFRLAQDKKKFFEKKDCAYAGLISLMAAVFSDIKSKIYLSQFKGVQGDMLRSMLLSLLTQLDEEARQWIKDGLHLLEKTALSSRSLEKDVADWKRPLVS